MKKMDEKEKIAKYYEDKAELEEYKNDFILHIMEYLLIVLCVITLGIIIASLILLMV